MLIQEMNHPARRIQEPRPRSYPIRPAPKAKEGIQLTLRQTKQAASSLAALRDLQVNVNGIVMPLRNYGPFRELMAAMREAT